MSLSRRELFHSTALLAGTFASAAVVPLALAQSDGPGGGQVTKQVADYRTEPNGQQRCSLCANFQAPSGCVVVSGVVVPNGWCRLFKPKSG